jgi:hypothetical protein
MIVTNYFGVFTVILTACLITGLFGFAWGFEYAFRVVNRHNRKNGK